jgi:hypothetical protein
MQDNVDSDLRQNMRTMLGISVKDGAYLDLLVSNDGYTAQTTGIDPISFHPRNDIAIYNRNPCYNHIRALSRDGKSIS